MTEYEIEPVPGLPGQLPPGEQILWQGSPAWRTLARTAFHTRGVAIYFALLALVALAFGNIVGVAMTALLGAVALGLLHLLAWGSARTTIYTLTNRRIVFRIGMAVPKCINLPLSKIAAVDVGGNDILLTLGGAPKLGYLALWPHARPLRIARPQPMLRAIPNTVTVAKQIAGECTGSTSTFCSSIPELAVAA